MELALYRLPLTHSEEALSKKECYQSGKCPTQESGAKIMTTWGPCSLTLSHSQDQTGCDTFPGVAGLYLCPSFHLSIPPRPHHPAYLQTPSPLTQEGSAGPLLAGLLSFSCALSPHLCPVSPLECLLALPTHSPVSHQPAILDPRILPPPSPPRATVLSFIPGFKWSQQTGH